MSKSRNILEYTPAEWGDIEAKNIYFHNYSEMGIMRIGGTFNIPTLSTTLLERACFYYGACAVVETPEYGWVTLPVVPAGELGVYFVPRRWRARAGVKL